MSSCEQIQFLISQLIDRELDKEEAALVAEHLKSCEDCAAMYRAFSGLSEDLEEPPESLRENVMAELRRGEMAKKNRRLSRPVRSLLAAAACMALIIGLAYGTAPLLRSPAAVDTAQAPAAAVPAGGAAGEREAVVLMAEAVVMDAPAEAALDLGAAPEEESTEGSAPAPAPASVPAPVYSAADSSGTVTVEAPETAEDVKEAAVEAPAPLPVEAPEKAPEEAPAAYSAFSTPSAPDAGKAADYIECWDGEKQGELMDLLKGKVMAISARVAGQEELSDEELAESPAYIFSLDESGQRQINVYIRDGKVYYADSEEGFMLAHCSEEELESFLAQLAA